MLSAALFQTGCAGTDQTQGRVLRALAGLKINDAGSFKPQAQQYIATAPWFPH